MRLLKDLIKLKNILLAIDVLLLAAVIAAAAACLYWDKAETQIANIDFNARLEELNLRESELDQKIAEVEAILQKDFTDLLTEKSDGEQALTDAQLELEDLTGQYNKVSAALSDIHDPLKMQEHIANLRTEYGQAIRQLEDKILAGESEYKICYLTFDDGPTYHTHKFLDELEKLDAYATFFTIGCGIRETANEYIRDDALRRTAMAGHTIANHTYTHAYYGPLYRSLESFMDAVREQDELVYRITGLHTDIVRFPCGSHYSPHRTESIQALADEGYTWMDWIANAMDAGDNGYNSKYIANSIIWQVRHDPITVVLMHDWNTNTLGALDQIITTLKAENYLFLPLFKESWTNENCKPRWG